MRDKNFGRLRHLPWAIHEEICRQFRQGDSADTVQVWLRKQGYYEGVSFEAARRQLYSFRHRILAGGRDAWTLLGSPVTSLDKRAMLIEMQTRRVIKTDAAEERAGAPGASGRAEKELLMRLLEQDLRLKKQVGLLDKHGEQPLLPIPPFEAKFQGVIAALEAKYGAAYVYKHLGAVGRRLQEALERVKREQAGLPESLPPAPNE